MDQLTTEDAQAEFLRMLPCTIDNIETISAFLLAPWVKQQNLEYLAVEQGRTKVRLRQDPYQQFFLRVMCGQALMSAIDTVMSLAMLTYPKAIKGTAGQNTRFLRPAIGDDLIIEAKVLKMGQHSAYGETHVSFEGSGKLVAHATSDYAL